MARRSRKRPPKSGDAIRLEIHDEIRSILRLLTELRTPLQLFLDVPGRPTGAPRYYVVFDSSTPHEITGLRIGALTIRLHDSTIVKRCYECAITIWHLKDRLHQWFKQGPDKASVDVETWAAASTPLLLCGDLANFKKHGRTEMRSGMMPLVSPEVTLDTSKSGVIELFWDTATKHKILYVSTPAPIPYKATIVRSEDTSQIITDGAETFEAAFRHWLPLICDSGILGTPDPESKALVKTLFLSGPIQFPL